MKTVRVAAAVIERNGLIFATCRGYGEFKGGWEFPGGKIEDGETPQQALEREIMEELDTRIKAGERIATVESDYPSFHLSMDCYHCTIVQGDLILKEAAEARWLKREELDTVNWLPADRQILSLI